jgi:hypothetical protein
MSNIFRNKKQELIIQLFTNRTVSTIVVGDYAGTANDLAGPPNDQVDIRKAILSLWPDFAFREFKDKTATGDRLLSEIRDAATGTPDDGMLLFLMDNCFSESNTRNGVKSHVLGCRFHPPEFAPVYPRIVKPILKGHEYDKVLVISACLSNQTAADAVFDGRANGALHYCLIKTLKKGITYRQWFEATKRLLFALGFSQVPTLDGPEELKDRLVFEGNVRVIDVSSHGTTVEDLNGDEPDGRDEALVMRDRVVIDDEIREALQVAA